MRFSVLNHIFGWISGRFLLVAFQHSHCGLRNPVRIEGPALAERDDSVLVPGREVGGGVLLQVEFGFETFFPVEGFPVPGDVLLGDPAVDDVAVRTVHADEDVDLAQTEEFCQRLGPLDFLGTVRTPGAHEEYEGPVLARILVERLFLPVELAERDIAPDFRHEGVETLHLEYVEGGDGDKDDDENLLVGHVSNISFFGEWGTARAFLFFFGVKLKFKSTIINNHKNN